MSLRNCETELRALQDEKSQQAREIVASKTGIDRHQFTIRELSLDNRALAEKLQTVEKQLRTVMLEAETTSRDAQAHKLSADKMAQLFRPLQEELQLSQSQETEAALEKQRLQSELRQAEVCISYMHTCTAENSMFRRICSHGFVFALYFVVLYLRQGGAEEASHGQGAVAEGE